jgi:hypothetical protein
MNDATRKKIPHRVRRGFRRLVALCAALASLGCLHLPTLPAPAAPAIARRPAACPTELAVFASPMPLEDANRNVHQGIFCRFYFFAGPDAPPIAVAGEIKAVVHRADAVEPEEPEAVFHVPAERLAKHKREDLIGVCYACWFPYHAAEQRDVVFQATFTQKDGRSVSSAPTRIRLEPVQNARAAESTRTPPR